MNKQIVSYVRIRAVEIETVEVKRVGLCLELNRLQFRIGSLRIWGLSEDWEAGKGQPSLLPLPEESEWSLGRKKSIAAALLRDRCLTTQQRAARCHCSESEQGKC